MQIRSSFKEEMLLKPGCYRIGWKGKGVWVGVDVPCYFKVQYDSNVFQILQVDFCVIKQVDHHQLITNYFDHQNWRELFFF